MKELFAKTYQNSIGLILFYLAILYVRLMGHSTFADFFSSSANEGVYELIVRLVLTVMILGSLILEFIGLLNVVSLHAKIRIVLRLYVWLAFTSTILYRIYPLPLPAQVLNICFGLGFMIELVLVYLQKVGQEEKLAYNDQQSIDKKDLLFSILSMLFLIVFQADGVAGTSIQGMMYLLLLFVLIKRVRKGYLVPRKFYLLLTWIISSTLVIQYLMSLDLVINSVYLFGRLTVRFGLYLFMYLPLYNHLLQRKKGS